MAAVAAPRARLAGDERGGRQPGASLAPSSQSLSVLQVSGGKAFSYTSELKSTSRLYRVYRFRYPSPIVTSVAENNTIPGDYYLPSAVASDSPSGRP